MKRKNIKTYGKLETIYSSQEKIVIMFCHYNDGYIIYQLEKEKYDYNNLIKWQIKNDINIKKIIIREYYFDYLNDDMSIVEITYK